jgi:DNA end-binding protein Ku
MEFVDLDQINPMFFEKPYYLEPSKPGRHAYALLREALEKAGKVAIARVVIRTKEQIAAVKPIGDALVLEIMHWADELVEQSTLDLPAETKLPDAELKMAKMLIDTMSVDKFEPEKFKNRYADELMAMIEARAAGKEVPKPKKAPARPKVVNLMDVLQQSLEESKKQRAARGQTAAHKAPTKRSGGRKKKAA